MPKRTMKAGKRASRKMGGQEGQEGCTQDAPQEGWRINGFSRNGHIER